jgi:hypothetical protein
LATEISNPYILSRKILRADGKEGTLIYNIHTTIFVVTFIFGRCFMGSFIVYNTWVIDTLILLKISVSAVYLISLYWCYVIMRMGSKMIIQSGKDNSWFVNLTRKIDKNQALLWVFLIMMSYILPIFLTQFLKTGPFVISFGGFNFI